MVSVRFGRQYDVAVPTPGGPNGSIHSVAQFDHTSGKPYVYLGDHALALCDFEESEGLEELNELDQQMNSSQIWNPAPALGITLPIPEPGRISVSAAGLETRRGVTTQ